jgi:hypothetical protein
MAARQKLNSITIYICLLLGATVAMISGTTTVFWGTAGILVLAAIHAGALRPTSGKKH